MKQNEYCYYAVVTTADQIIETYGSDGARRAKKEAAKRARASKSHMTTYHVVKICSRLSCWRDKEGKKVRCSSTWKRPR